MKDWSQVTLRISDSLEAAIKVLHHGGLRVALVIDKKNRLLGTITDGDIRRAILKHLEMDSLVGDVMNKNPLTALNSDSTEKVLSKMKSRDLLHVPIINNKGKLVGLETLQNLTYNKKYDNPIFIMAGGIGARLHPLTKDTPKPLLRVGSKPILENIIDPEHVGLHLIYSQFKNTKS